MGFKKKPVEEEIITRVKLPKDNEVLGIIEQRLGGNKMSVNCLWFPLSISKNSIVQFGIGP